MPPDLLQSQSTRWFHPRADELRYCAYDKVPATSSTRRSSADRPYRFLRQAPALPDHVKALQPYGSKSALALHFISGLRRRERAGQPADFQTLHSSAAGDFCFRVRRISSVCEAHMLQSSSRDTATSAINVKRRTGQRSTTAPQRYGSCRHTSPLRSSCQSRSTLTVLIRDELARQSFNASGSRPFTTLLAPSASTSALDDGAERALRSPLRNSFGDMPQPANVPTTFQRGW